MTLPLPPTLPSVDAVIFDADGTLVDSETPGLEVLHAHALALGVRFEPGEGVETWRGRPMPDALAELARRLGRPLPADFEAVMRAAMADRFREGLLAMPGAQALLEALQAQHTPFCVATNGPRPKVELTLSLTGLRGYFGEHVYCAYEVGLFKPDPGLFLAAAQALGAQPARCVVVEDSPPGIAAGLAAGMRVYALRSPMVEALQAHPRLRVVEGLEDLRREPWMATR
ncbi:HAD family hydrolase [Ramlibacter sp. MAHUQ-53]|uniref:HAD family hydrolase n=1 Tax=unclassified Ramlibacter TaxID=2617605 RepID=UPI00363CF9AB